MSNVPHPSNVQRIPIRAGMSGGGIGYGYELVPGQTGALRIDEAKAPVVVRILEEYAAGRSPRAIAMQLNKEAVPGPRGRPWRDTTIRGHITRGTGILNNELYVGRRVWRASSTARDSRKGMQPLYRTAMVWARPSRTAYAQQPGC